MIYVVEDDRSIRDLVCYALKQQGLEAVGFERGQDFLRAAERDRPDLVLLDRMLPFLSGDEVLRHMKRHPVLSDVPVMMLTAKAEEMDKVLLLDLGADDYMTKPFGVLELLSRVRAVLRRTRRHAGEAQTYHGLALDESRHLVLAEGQEVPLTLKEFELLQALLAHRETVLTRDKLLGMVWNAAFHGDTRTVDAHIKTLRKKLGACGDMIQTVRGVGYMLMREAAE